MFSNAKSNFLIIPSHSVAIMAILKPLHSKSLDKEVNLSDNLIPSGELSKLNSIAESSDFIFLSSCLISLMSGALINKTPPSISLS
ncbi:MAG: Uncharacterised protein [Methanobacteriota archaeon]|nr:MAG: Uncharacterised protein [Euryarchaeota archaeon]